MYNHLLILQCEHRYTGRPICANPCDGRDDLCLDNSDEQGCSYYLPIMYLFLANSVTLSIVLTLVEYFRRRRKSGAEGEQSSTIELQNSELVMQCFCALRQCQGLSTARLLAEQFYKFHYERNGNGVKKTELALFHLLGSSKATMDFLDAVDYGLPYKLGELIQARTPKFVLDAARSSLGHRARFFCLLIVSITLYYTDLCKDIALAVQFKMGVMGGQDLTTQTFEKNTYPALLFCLIVASIMVTEAMNFISVLLLEKFKVLGYKRRLLCSLATPLVPGMAIYEWRRAELHLNKLYESLLVNVENMTSVKVSSASTLTTLVGAKSVQIEQRMRSAHFRMNENVVEHLSQFSLIVVVFLTEYTETPAVQTVGRIIVNRSLLLLAVSAGLSLLSIIKGHIEFIGARKAGHLPTVGKIILVAFFLLCIISRLLAIVVFFTPILGLFNTLRLAQFGTIKGSDDLTHEAFYGGNTLADEWGPFETSPGDFFRTQEALIAYASIPPALLVLHFVFGIIIGKLACRKEDSWHLAVFTLIAPPLFLDWEEMYRHKRTSTISQCWIKNILLLTASITLYAIEHVVSCIPLYLLKHLIDLRAEAMSGEGFPLLPEEAQSIWLINAMLLSIVTASCLIMPVLQLILALLYFKHGHAWSRVLRREARIFPWDSVLADGEGKPSFIKNSN